MRAGKNAGNPIAAILSATLMLRHLGEGGAATRVRQAVETVIGAGQCRTRDLGGNASTTELTQAIIKALPRDTRGPSR